ILHDVRDDVDLVLLGEPVALARGWLDLAKQLGERDVIARLELLVAEHDDAMLGQEAHQGLHLRGCRFARLQARNLYAEIACADAARVQLIGHGESSPLRPVCGRATIRHARNLDKIVHDMTSGTKPAYSAGRDHGVRTAGSPDE